MKPHVKRQAMLSLVAAACMCEPVLAKLPPGISGPWFNSAQSGHGLSVDLVAPDRAVVFWYAYDNDGNPMTLYIEGRVQGRQIDGIAYAPRGMRFGQFNPADLQLPEWGRVTLSFDSCSSGSLSWDANSSEFVDGAISIEKLAQLDGLQCQLPPANDLPVGLVTGTRPNANGNPATFEVQGMVDREGRLWSIDRGLNIPGPTWVGLYPTTVSIIEPVSIEANGAVRAQGFSAEAQAFTFFHSGAPQYYEGVWRRGTGASLLLNPDSSVTALRSFNRYTATAPAGYQLVAPATLQDLSRGFSVRLRGQFVEFDGTFSVGADGQACYVISNGSTAGCSFSGKLAAGEGDFGLFDFELSSASLPTAGVYRGRGWLVDGPTGRELILVGSNGHIGLGLIGRER